MYINGVRDYDREGKEVQTGLFAGKVTRDAEVRTTSSGKQYCTTSVRALTRMDGTPAFLNIKAWDSDLIDQLQGVCKGDRILAAGRISTWESQNGNTNTDLIPDFLLISCEGNAHTPAGADYQRPYREIPEDDQDGELPFKQGLRLPMTKGGKETKWDTQMGFGNLFLDLRGRSDAG